MISIEELVLERMTPEERQQEPEEVQSLLRDIQRKYGNSYMRGMDCWKDVEEFGMFGSLRER